MPTRPIATLPEVTLPEVTLPQRRPLRTAHRRLQPIAVPFRMTKSSNSHHQVGATPAVINPTSMPWMQAPLSGLP